MSAAPGVRSRVLDVCAAPGGKSFALAIDMQDGGEILSCDVYPHKLRLIESGAQRLGIGSVRALLADAREHHAAWDRQADLVVADVSLGEAFPYCVAVQKGDPKGLLPSINATIAKLIADGKIEQYIADAEALSDQAIG